MAADCPQEYIYWTDGKSQYYSDQTTSQSRQPLEMILDHARLFRTAKYRAATEEMQEVLFKGVVQNISDAVQNYEQATLQPTFRGLRSKKIFFFTK